MSIEVKDNVINKEVLKRNKKYLIPAWKKYLTCIYVLVFLSLSIFCFIQETFRMKIFATIFLISAIVVILVYSIISNKNINTLLAMQMEIYGEKDIFYSLTFEDTSILLANNKNRINYASITKIVETRKDFVFFARTGYFIICQKSNLGNNDKEFYNLISRIDAKWIKVK